MNDGSRSTPINRKFLLQLLPGFIPLLLYIIADEIWGNRVGLCIAILTGLLELSYYWIRYKKIDRFILSDTLLIIILGIISIILNNAVFFKIKPGIIALIMVTIVGISAFTPENWLQNMSKRYMKGIELSDEQNQHMKRNLKKVFWLFSVYTALVFYSVWFMSNEAWLFISGPLFYILMISYILYEFLQNKVKKNHLTKNEEWLPVLDINARIIGKALRSVCHSNKEFLHPVVHLHILNTKGEIFLQKRSMNKIQPGKWDTSVGGHVAVGEEIEIALHRETLEELGIKEFHYQLLEKYIWESEIEREFVFSFIAQYDGPIQIDKKELSDGRFWAITEISKNLGKGVFTPNFEIEFEKILKLKRSR